MFYNIIGIKNIRLNDWLSTLDCRLQSNFKCLALAIKIQNKLEETLRKLPSLIRVLRSALSKR